MSNINAIYSRIGHNEWGVISAANTAKDGTGTVVTIFTADGTNGSRVERIRFKSKGTNIATVCRVFINNGGTNATATNNTLIAEITLPATTLSEVAALTPQDLPLAVDDLFPIVLQPNHKLLFTLGTAVAAGYAITVFGGDY
jgi:hypothetical protein